MSKKISKIPFFLLIILFIILFSTSIFAFSSQTAFANDNFSNFVRNETLTLAHISDVHYFPLEYCYVFDEDENGNKTYIDKTSQSFLNSDFNNATYGDTKLVTESGIILTRFVYNMIDKTKLAVTNLQNALNSQNANEIDLAKKQLDEIPDVLIVSGDLSKNSERVALIDVANAFRFLQNEMRKISYLQSTEFFPFENFQILVAPGNHDLYNGEGKVYDAKNQGKEFATDTLDTTLFSQIFAGLGYPDVPNENYKKFTLQSSTTIGSEKIESSRKDSFWFGEFTGEYVFSTNAKNMKISYYSDALQNISDVDKTNATVQDFQNIVSNYESIGEKNNVLSYVAEFSNEKTFSDSSSTGVTIVMCDSSDRTKTEEKVVVVATASQIANRSASNPIFSFDEATQKYADVTNLSNQELLKLLQNDKNLYYNTSFDHITGGKITEKFLDWLENFISTSTSATSNVFSSGTDETLIFSSHHNILPHFDAEDELLKDFTVYNWEYVANRLIGMNVKMALTGHMHVNDVQNYVDSNGKVLYDCQTGSLVSYTSPTRTIKISRDYFNKDMKNFVAEDFAVNILQTDNLKELPSSNIIKKSELSWNEVEVDNNLSNSQKFALRYNANKDFFTYAYCYEDLNTSTFNEYINQEIYSQIVDRILNHFLSEKTLVNLENKVESTIVSMLNELYPNKASALEKPVSLLAKSLIQQIATDLPIEYNGVTVEGTTNCPKLFEFLKLLAGDLLSTEFGENEHKLTLKDLIPNFLLLHTQGIEFDSENEIFNAVLPENASKMQYDRFFTAKATAQLFSSLKNGSFVEMLLDKVLTPLLFDANSLLKTLLYHNFDFSNIGLSSTEIETIYSVFATIKKAFEGTDANMESVEKALKLDSFNLGVLLDSANSLLDSALGALAGINLNGMTVLEFAENFILKYMVDNFYTSTGGILFGYLKSFVVDKTKDNQDNLNTHIYQNLRFSIDGAKDENYATIQTSNEILKYTFVQNQLVSQNLNKPTTENGRIPSSLTSNFDLQNPTTSYCINFYTSENIFARFELYDEDGNFVTQVETNQSQLSFAKSMTEKSAKGLEQYIAKASRNGIDVNLKTLTIPTYVPLVDFGVVCVSHSEIEYQKKVDGKKTTYLFSSDMRDGQIDENGNLLFDKKSHTKNSIIFKNKHSINISGLSAGTTYKFKIFGINKNGVKFEKTADNGSFQFSTAPDENTTKFNFLAVADLQSSILTDYQNINNVFDKIENDTTLSNYQFILNAGDMTDNGKNFSQWSWATNSISNHLGKTSMLMSAGNHEKKSNAMKNFFNFNLAPTDTQNQESGIYYSLNYGSLHIVVLNTNDANASGLSQKQLTWLESDLKDNKSTWTVVLMHKGLYTVGAHSNDFEVVEMRKQLTPLFAQYDVDIVLAGHDHTYTTTKVIGANGKEIQTAYDQNGRISNIENGVVYMTLGTMGNKFYNYDENSSINSLLDEKNSVLKTLTNPTFAFFEIDGKNLSVKGIEFSKTTNEFSEIGKFEITKMHGDIANAQNSIKLNGENLHIDGKKTIIDFNGYKLNFSFETDNLPENTKLALLDDNGGVLDSKIGFFEKTKTFNLYLQYSDGTKIKIGNATIVRENFELNIGLIFGSLTFVIVLAISIPLGIVFSNKKKKSKIALDKPNI